MYCNKYSILSVFGSRLNTHAHIIDGVTNDEKSVEGNPQKEQNSSIQVIITFGPCVAASHRQATSQLDLLLLLLCASECDRSNYSIVICIPLGMQSSFSLSFSFALAACAHTVSNIKLKPLRISISSHFIKSKKKLSCQKNVNGRICVSQTVHEYVRCHLET